MANLLAAVYEPPGPELPDVAIIVNEDGKVIFAQAVADAEDGEALIKLVVEGLRLLALGNGTAN